MGRPFTVYSDGEEDSVESGSAADCHLGLTFKTFSEQCMQILEDCDMEDEAEDEIQAVLRWLFAFCSTAYVPTTRWAGAQKCSWEALSHKHDGCHFAFFPHVKVP